VKEEKDGSRWQSGKSASAKEKVSECMERSKNGNALKGEEDEKEEEVAEE
jgi:hypothetical protein